MTTSDARRAILRVGDGCGFIVQGKLDRYVITAARCLPHLPWAQAAASSAEGLTYERLLGSLGAEPAVPVECLFVDPIADIAVLGSPDDQAHYGEYAAAAYEALIGPMVPLRVTSPPPPTVGPLQEGVVDG
jgi:hypothetical protein